MIEPDYDDSIQYAVFIRGVENPGPVTAWARGYEAATHEAYSRQLRVAQPSCVRYEVRGRYGVQFDDEPVARRD